MFSKLQAGFAKFIDEHLENAALYLFQHRTRVALGDALFSAILYAFGHGTWALWAHVLLLQNWAFTYVSRARNSGSLSRHLRAGFLSNFVWWVSTIIIYSRLNDYLHAKHGILKAVLTGLYYTAFTLTGSIVAHAQSLRSEKGKGAVGANVKFHQITIEEWANIQHVLADFERVTNIAEQAHACAVSAIPTTAVATKIAGETVVSGL